MKRIFSRDERNEQRRAQREAWHQRQVGGMAPMKPLPPPHQPTDEEIEFAKKRDAMREFVPYPQHCRHPDQCQGRTYCPRDPICID